MRGRLFDNMDIDLILSEEEFNSTFLKLEEKDRRELECELIKMDRSSSGRTATLGYSDFSGYLVGVNDGVKVDYDLENKNYSVKVNNHALTSIDGRGRIITRYGNDWKIGIYIAGRSEYTQ
jgi:hypothetical protein